MSGGDFSHSLYKLLNMTLACRPSDPVDFAALFFSDEQQLEHELAHAVHQVRFFEENKIKFREQVSAMFFSEMEKQEQSALPATDSLPLSSAIKIIKALYGENLSMLTVILEHFRPGQFLSFKEFEVILEWTIICLNFSTYLKTFLCDAMNKLLPAGTQAANMMSIRFLDQAFECLQHDTCTHTVEVDRIDEVLLPNIMGEDITAVKWKHRTSSVLHAQNYFQQADTVKLDEFLNECVSHYFGILPSGPKKE